MKIKIDFNTRSLFLDYIKDMDNQEKETAFEDADNNLTETWKRLFESLQNERIDCIWYYPNSKQIYTFHRSTKKTGCIQKSCFWIKGDEYIALSDRQYFTFDDFRRDAGLQDKITIYTTKTA